MNRTVKNWLNYEPKEGKKFTQPSQTIPDQTMSMRTILERHARGLPVIGADPKEAYYDGGEYLPDPNTLDLADRETLKEQLTEELEAIKAREIAYQKQEKSKKDKQTQLDLEKAIDEAKKALIKENKGAE